MKRKLGSYESALARTNEYSPLNAVCVIRLSALPTLQIVQKVFNILQNRHPLLRARISKEDQSYFFDIASNPIGSIDVKLIEGKNSWESIVEEELNRQINCYLEPLLSCILHRPDPTLPEGEMIINFQHTIMDGRSGMNLLHELLHTCQRLEAGEEISELALLPLQPASDELFPARYRGVSGLIRRAGYAARQMTDEAKYRWNTRKSRRPPIKQGGSNRLLSMTFDVDLTESLVENSRSKRIPINSLLNAAMMLAVNRHLYKGAAVYMQTISFADLRSFLIPPVSEENLGSYISMLRYSLIVSSERGIWSLAEELQDKINRSFERGDKFIAQSMSLPMMRMILRSRSFRMASTALSYSGPAAMDSAFGNIQVMGLHGFISNIDLGPEYSAQVHIFNDRLVWDIVYLDADMDHSTAESIAEEIEVLLNAAVGRSKVPKGSGLLI